MKRYVRPGAEPPPDEYIAPKEKVGDPDLSEISVARLLDDGLLGLYREIKNLLLLSAKGKLSSTDSRDLRDSIKLLFELKERENELLKGLSDEQLEALKNENK